MISDLTGLGSLNKKGIGYSKNIKLNLNTVLATLRPFPYTITVNSVDPNPQCSFPFGSVPLGEYP